MRSQTSSTMLMVKPASALSLFYWKFYFWKQCLFVEIILDGHCDNISTNVSFLAYCDERASRQVSSNNVVMIAPPPPAPPPPPLPLQVINNPTSPFTPISKIVIIYMCLSSFQWHTINQTPPVNFSPALPILTRIHPARGRRRRLTMLRKWWLTTFHLNRNSTITTAGLVAQNNTIPFVCKALWGEETQERIGFSAAATFNDRKEQRHVANAAFYQCH